MASKPRPDATSPNSSKGPSDIVAELRQAASVDSAARLLDLSEGTDKSLAKAARTALYQLKLKGI